MMIVLKWYQFSGTLFPCYFDELDWSKPLQYLIWTALSKGFKAKYL